jgi:hypothetical protein
LDRPASVGDLLDGGSVEAARAEHFAGGAQDPRAIGLAFFRSVRAAPLCALCHRFCSLFGLYLVLAGLERFLVEFIRRNQPVLWGLTQPQVFALAMLGAGAVVVGWSRAARAQPTVSFPRL